MITPLLTTISFLFVQSPQAPRNSPDMFKDVPKSERLYQDELKLHWNGDPRPLRDDNDYFGSGRLPTRYEYAVLVDRTLRDIERWKAHFPGADPLVYDEGVHRWYAFRWQARPVKDPAAFLSMVREIKPELASLGNNVEASETLASSLLDDKPITLSRTFKKGEVARHKAESEIQAGAGEAKLVGTSKTTVKEVKDNGQVVYEEAGEGGKLTLNGMDIDVPPMPPATATREKNGRLVELKVDENALGAQSPEVTRLMASIGTPILVDRAVKPGDTWDTEIDNLAVKTKKVKIKTTFVGTEKVDGKELWKLKQAAEPDVDATGGKMTYEGTFWLDPANGQETRSEYSVKGMPSQYGELTIKTKSTRLKESDKTDK